MKITLKNLGILKHAEFSLGDLTIICGENNTGKTYATYALYGFLADWRKHIRFPLDTTLVQGLLTEGALKVPLKPYVEMGGCMLARACKRYTNRLDDVYSAAEGQFSNSEFHLQLDIPNILDKELKGEIEITQERHFAYSKRRGSDELTVTLMMGKEQEKPINSSLAGFVANAIISNAIFADSFPTPFISTAERTGVTIFRKELNFARNRVLEEMGRADQKIDPREILFKAYQSYPQPIEDNVNFIRQLEELAKRKSYIAKEDPEVLENFAGIIGGEYTITQNDQLYYTPKGTRLKLTMVESSSAVRSLLDLGFYLRHVAYPGSLLMVDEPELNLHPANQRRIARLFAHLVNLGVKVFITTHSDYIVKELNTLIMLNHDKPHLKRIAQENGYRQSELIRSDEVKVYTAREELMPLEEGQKRRRRGYTLVEADINPVLGIEAPSFDETIDDMNRIQEDIIWGAE